MRIVDRTPVTGTDKIDKTPLLGERPLAAGHDQMPLDLGVITSPLPACVQFVHTSRRTFRPSRVRHVGTFGPRGVTANGPNNSSIDRRELRRKSVRMDRRAPCVRRLVGGTVGSARAERGSVMWEWHSAWAWWCMGVAMVIFWGLVAWVVVTLVRRSGPSDRTSEARGLLDERFARGEIDEDEYRRRRALIRR